MVTVCTRCGSEDYRKNGSYEGVQRYCCNECNAYFSSRPRKFNYEDKARALDMYLNNVGIRKIGRFINASPALVLRWIRSAGKMMSERLARASEQIEQKLPDVIEMDEIYTFIKKNSKERSYGLLILEDKTVLLRTSSGIKGLKAH